MYRIDSEANRITPLAVKRFSELLNKSGHSRFPEVSTRQTLLAVPATETALSKAV